MLYLDYLVQLLMRFVVFLLVMVEVKTHPKRPFPAEVSDLDHVMVESSESHRESAWDSPAAHCQVANVLTMLTC